MDQLAALLEGSLSGVGAARAQCEAQLTTLLRSSGFALQLCEFLFTTTAAVAPAHRQLACILLKKLVMSHWTVGATGDEDDEHEAPAAGDVYLVADAEKAQVRHAIVASVQRVDVLAFFAESKLQTALCMALTAIFERDWPDQWPELLPVVLGMISGNERLAIEFAIRFLSLAGNHFSSENCCELVSVVFPQLQRVFVAKDDFAVGVRTRVVRIVESSLLMVGMEAQVGNKTAQQLLQTNVSQWIALFLAELPLPVQQVKAYAIKIQIINTLSKFVEEWPKDMTDVLPEIMPQIYGLLASDMAAFDRDVVQNSETEEEAYDSDGEGTHIGRGAVVVAAFEFLRGTLHAPTKKTRQLVLTALNEFVYVMIAYMQITASQAETWEDDPNKYVADEDDESLSYNIRTAGTDLLIELETVLGRKAVVAALDAAQRRLKGEAGNWRLQEAALLVVGTLASPILAAMSKQSADVSQLLDLGSFLQTLFQVMNASNETIYLRARALWCASKLAKGMNSEMLSAFLQVAISGLEQGQVLPVRLYACRAVGAIVKHEAGKQHLQEASAVVVERLIHLAELSTNETLHIALETLVVVLQELGNLNPAAAQATVAAFLRHWSQNLNDPLISELLDGAFGALLEYENMEIVANLQEQVLPVLQTMLLQSKAELGAAGNGTVIAGSAITVLKTILKHSFVSSTATAAGSSDPTHRAMSAQIIQLIFEPLIGILQLVDDEKVLNSGAECLKWLVMFAVETLAEYKCANGANGVDATMNIAAKLLSPALDESCAVCVGGLIAQILLKLGSALPPTTIQSILSATCARLATAELPSLIQSLCMVFARLVHTHGQEILNVLEQLPAPAVPGVSYKNMLEFVFSTWIEKQQDFYGLYCIKVTVSALLKVAEWNDPRLTEIIVTGSEIETAPQPGSAGIQTRSKTKSSTGSAPKQYTRVHFLTKLVVVLAKVAVHLGEDEEEWESSEDESEDDEDDDSAAVSGATSSSIFAPAEQYELLSDRLDSNAADAGDDEGADGLEEEFEAHFDPLNDVDLKVLLPAALQSVTSNGNAVQAMLPELTPADQEILALVTGAN
ncbi:hypothetical protein Poli38472_012961 [Pythium oligandrum]|uniref:Importin N-terminal domain-containing protein n=1 Tax=Pythium oligandrum TaxID=41045 RepID=A0A8K1CJR5_PYTOL|nr:hypothetical protein Poli38472_012961 [Pythium oligandrum]|eukprot:TMW64339.1 hypothetical protein Poli38472_012961 [Pythium oligandrum]